MSRVIAGIDQPKSAGGSERRSSGAEWMVVAAVGLAFAVVSLTDVALTFVPLGLGSAEWEFATATSVMNNIPVGLVGIAFVGVAGIARRSSGLRRSASVLAGLLTILVVLMVFFFARNIGVARASVEDPVLSQGLSEQIVRTAVQLAAYLGALAWLLVGMRKAA